MFHQTASLSMYISRDDDTVVYAAHCIPSKYWWVALALLATVLNLVSPWQHWFLLHCCCEVKYTRLCLLILGVSVHFLFLLICLDGIRLCLHFYILSGIKNAWSIQMLSVGSWHRIKLESMEQTLCSITQAVTWEQHLDYRWLVCASYCFVLSINMSNNSILK